MMQQAFETTGKYVSAALTLKKKKKEGGGERETSLKQVSQM